MASASRDRTVRVWSAVTGLCVLAMVDHENWVRGVLFHPCGRILLSVAEDRTLRAWRLARDGEVRESIAKLRS